MRKGSRSCLRLVRELLLSRVDKTDLKMSTLVEIGSVMLEVYNMPNNTDMSRARPLLRGSPPRSPS